VSTSADVQALITSTQASFLWQLDEDTAIVNAETHLLSSGEYRFFWQGEETGINPIYGWVTLQDSVVDYVGVQMNQVQTLTLEHALAVLGEPDHIYLDEQPYLAPSLDLIYVDILVRVEFTGLEDCEIQTIEQDYWATSVKYYSPTTAIEPVHTVTSEEAQPALVAYTSYSPIYVPIETWNAWLNGEVDNYCGWVLFELPEATELPTVAPTATIIPTLSR
jgi:hypothetical protein